MEHFANVFCCFLTAKYYFCILCKGRRKKTPISYWPVRKGLSPPPTFEKNRCFFYNFSICILKDAECHNIYLHIFPFQNILHPFLFFFRKILSWNIIYTWKIYSSSIVLYCISFSIYWLAFKFFVVLVLTMLRIF